MTTIPTVKNWVGIDYSMTSPAIAVYQGEPSEFHWEKVRFHFHTPTDTLAREWKRAGKVWCSGSMPITKPNGYMERFDGLSDWVMGVVQDRHKLLPHETIITLEDYALGARGRVFEIAENTGIMKHNLYINKFQVRLVAPTTLKKYATGKGNSDKIAMNAQWEKDTGACLQYLITPTRKLGNPVTDLVDAYYLCKYGIDNYQNI